MNVGGLLTNDRTWQINMNLPDNPTPEQLQAIALLTIKSVFEDDAEDMGAIEPLDDGWKTTYSAGGVEFEIEYSGGEFTKWPSGGGQDG